ncbi:MAG: hypothetical protein K9L70_03790 [Thiohalocapsa sp.]|nr:hypothetical protein [Thiohalocapsa sp.]MCF7989977.1 hypothetical protein [Thiohalocapsa sp.]
MSLHQDTEANSQDVTEATSDAEARSPVIVEIGSVLDITGKQPRGDKEDGGSINRLKYASESPKE